MITQCFLLKVILSVAYRSLVEDGQVCLDMVHCDSDQLVTSINKLQKPAIGLLVFVFMRLTAL